jgi:succinate dehydrogenase / fumarate reductase membrane anchor subunit
MFSTPMRIFSLLAIFALAAHAWVGLWTVFTDYVTESHVGPKANILRLFLQIGMVLVIFVYVIWGIQILWGH